MLYLESVEHKRQLGLFGVLHTEFGRCISQTSLRRMKNAGTWNKWDTGKAGGSRLCRESQRFSFGVGYTRDTATEFSLMHTYKMRLGSSDNGGTPDVFYLK